MKLPVTPPKFVETFRKIISQPDGIERLGRLAERLGPALGGKYRHWDTFRQTLPLLGFTAEEQWLGVKMARRALYRPLPLKDVSGVPFNYAIPTPALEMLLKIDRNASGNIQGSEQITSAATRDTYLFKSIVEEAITSSQLEGASTTRKVAKAMIQEGRSPRNRSEQMILNNYQAMLQVRKYFDKPLTPAMVMELQRKLTEGALDDPSAAGRFRTNEENIVVEDETGTRRHTPPRAEELPEGMERMCAFANGETPNEFLHPVIRSIILHFWLAYDHPFVDGNGRTARALFYWSMAKHGYWLCEYVSISRILKKARGQYARSYLYTETDDNDITYFVLYQMRVLLRAIEDLHQYLTKRELELRDVEELVRHAALINGNLNHRQLAVLHHALRNPDARYTVASHQVSHGVVYETARSDLLRLVELQLLEQHKSGKAFVFVPAQGLRDRLKATRL